MAARTVADVMTGVPVTVAANDDVAVAAEKMCNERIHRVLVTEDGRLVGLLSALDLVGLLIDMD
jgi:CBS domain-containing protein